MLRMVWRKSQHLLHLESTCDFHHCARLLQPDIVQLYGEKHTRSHNVCTTARKSKADTKNQTRDDNRECSESSIIGDTRAGGEYPRCEFTYEIDMIIHLRDVDVGISLITFNCNRSEQWQYVDSGKQPHRQHEYVISELHRVESIVLVVIDSTSLRMLILNTQSSIRFLRCGRHTKRLTKWLSDW